MPSGSETVPAQPAALLNRARYRGALLGLAVGDAVGAAVEFRPRGSFAPVTDMVGGGPWALEPGQWTDDTSMALCLAESLTECGGFDALDQIQRYVRWWQEGHWACKGYCFDIGNTTRGALRRFVGNGEPMAGSREASSAGNGSIMRLAPVPMAFALSQDHAVEMAAESSRTTHGAAEALDACRLLGDILVRGLRGEDKESLLIAPHLSLTEPAIRRLAAGEYRAKNEAQIRGSGYVVKSLEAALWCFAHTENYRDAVLRATNLGDDSDTTAAIVGQIAGAHYGVEGIPAGWLEKLTKRAEIESLADGLYELAQRLGSE